MEAALQIASIIVSLMLIVMILLQVRGSGGLGSLLGGDAGGGISRTRRGLDKTMFQITIALSIAFITISILSVFFYNR